MRSAVAVVVLLAAALGLSGCESTDPIPVPTHSQVVGTWTHGTSRLQLREDDSFVLTGVPTGVVRQTETAAGTEPAGPDISVEGSWKIGSGGNDAGGAPAVQLDFTKRVAAFGGLTLLVEGTTESNRQLYVNLGNPDSGIQYAYTRT